MGKFKKMMEVTSNAGYIGDEGEPDTGFIKGNKKRILNRHRGSKPENWYERGGYTQIDFPKADYIYGKGEDEEYSVKKKAYVTKIDKQFQAEFEKWEDWTIEKDLEKRNTVKESTTTGGSPGPKGYTAFLKEPDEWEGKKKSLASFYKKAMGYLLVERVDYYEIAFNLVRKYRSTLIF